MPTFHATVILEKHSVPDQGVLEIHASVQIHTSAHRAQGLVRHWLLTDVSTMMGADEPDLVIGEDVAWRVPVWIAFAQQGRYTLGAVDVHVERSEIVDAAQTATALQQRADEIASTLPSYAPRRVDPAYLVDKPTQLTNS